MRQLRELVAAVIDRFRRGHCVMLGCPLPPNGRGALCLEHELEQQLKNARRVDELMRERGVRS